MKGLVTIKITDDIGWTLGRVQAVNMLHAIYTWRDGQFEEGHKIKLRGNDPETATDATVTNLDSGEIVARFKVVSP
jgi:hypothetical protein